MKFVRRVKGCTKLDRIRNRDIRIELNIFNVNEKIKELKVKENELIERMDEYRLSTRARFYKSGKSKHGYRNRQSAEYPQSRRKRI